jgi:hypothetical protein
MSNYQTQFKWGFLSLLGLGMTFLGCINYHSQAETTLPKAEIRYEIDRQPNRIIHTIFIPQDSNYTVSPAVTSGLATIENLVNKQNGIAAINGGYFDPKNQKTTSYIIQDGKTIADPRTNERLIDNPDLQSYMGKILNRAEFRRYLCDKEIRYDITLHSTSIPANCQLQDALGGGPNLLPIDTSVKEGFIAYEGETKIRDAIGSDNPNARSAIALTAAGDIIFAMVEQTADFSQNSGLSLPELSEFLSSLGAIKAMNLDGGSSSAVYYRGKTIYGKVDKEGNKIQRPIKSILVVTEN